MLIYKILRSAEWNSLRARGETEGAPIDIADGYIHFSTREQLEQTVARHFAGEENLFLVAVDADSLGDDLHWEVSRGNMLFPHLYCMLQLADVVWAKPIPLVDNVHRLPD